MTAEIGDVGTLRELDVNPGDVVIVQSTWRGESVQNGVEWIIKRSDGTWHYGVKPDYVSDHKGVRLCNITHFRLISRATPHPKLWRDMTPEEKGALLLSAHEGKVIEYWKRGTGGWSVKPNVWSAHESYRVKPEPVRETVVFDDKYYSFKIMKGRRITFNTIDGVHDCTSVKMEYV